MAKKVFLSPYIRERIRKLFEQDGFSISELVIMYRDRLPKNKLKAILKIRHLVSDLKRRERV